MVYSGKSQSKMDDGWWYTHGLETSISSDSYKIPTFPHQWRHDFLCQERIGELSEQWSSVKSVKLWPAASTGKQLFVDDTMMEKNVTKSVAYPIY